MNSSNNLDHNQNFINLTKLQRKAWTGTESSAKKIDRKCIVNRAYFALFSMLISIIITLFILLIHYKNQFQLAKISTASLNSTKLTVMNGLNQTTAKLCLSKECIKSSAYLLERIDFTANPCEDFYKYACGKFLKTRTVPDDHISRNILQEIQDDIYIEMKNYLEKGLEDETDEKTIDEKRSTDKKSIKIADGRQSNENNLIDETKMTNATSLSTHGQSDLTIEDLDQDKFSESVLKKRHSNEMDDELNAVKKVKMFYRSCINETTVNDESTSVNVILNLIYEYGGEWPLLSKSSYFNNTFKQIRSIQNPTYRFDQNSNKTKIKNKLEKRIFSVYLHQIQPIFHFYVAPEEFKRNSKDYAIHLYSGSTILESSYFTNSTTSNNITTPQLNYRDAYIRLQLDILIRLAAIKGRSVNQTDAKLALEKVVAFEADLANITKLFAENSTTQNEDIITDMNATKNNLQNESNLNSNLPMTGNYSGESVPPVLNTQQQRSKTTYIRLNLTTLETKFNFIGWRFLFEQMEKSSQTKITELLLENTDYLEQIELLFKRHDPITIDNYLCWATIARFLPYLGSNFRRTFTDFRRKIPEPPVSNDLQQVDNIATNLFDNLNLFNNKNSDSNGYRLLDRYRRRKNSATTTGRMFLSRWKECVHLTSEGLKKPIAILYLQEKKDYVEKISEKVNTMVNNIMNAFFKIVDKQDWLLNDEIKAMVKKRAESIKSKIGFPRYLMDMKSADEQFEDLEIKLGDVFVANIIKMVRHEIKSELRMLNETIDPDKDWMIDTLIPNAYYDALNHFIILPVAILREPLISLQRPKYLDYATLGVVIGHELSHAFDTGTRKELNSNLMSLNNLNKTTNNVNTSWWPKELNLEYEKKSQCFVKQFNNYSVDELNENLNGNLTLEENICDFSGFQQAYYAYVLNKADEDDVLLPGLTNLSPEQIFFVQYAQVWCEISNKEGYKKALLDSHSPGRFRANGVVANSKQYSNAFNCKPNEPMNLANKCDLWAY